KARRIRTRTAQSRLASCRLTSSTPCANSRAADKIRRCVGRISTTTFQSTDGGRLPIYKLFLRQIVPYGPTAHPLRLHQKVEVVRFVVFSGAAPGLSRPHRGVGVDHGLTGAVRTEYTFKGAGGQGGLSNLR